MRNLFMATGQGGYFGGWNGNPGPLAPWSQGRVGALGPSLGNKVTPYGNAAGEAPSGIGGREHGMTSAPILPGYFPWQMRVMTSPLIPFDETTNLTDIFVLDSSSVGFLLEDEALTQVEWRDENVESVKVKLRERYGFGVQNEGHGIGVLKNIRSTRNFFDGTLKATFGDGLAEIPSTTAVV